jgi:hypothetical protein
MKFKAAVHIIVATLIACITATSADATGKRRSTDGGATQAAAALLDASERTTSARRSHTSAGRAQTARGHLHRSGTARTQRKTASNHGAHNASTHRQGRAVGSHVATHSTPQASGVGPRPAQWCGWYMRTQKGGSAAYNLASSWRNYGSPAAPQVGAVVVWPHHVGMIVGQAPGGQWIIRSGNDSGAVRDRPRSLSGAAVRI